jgi:NTP pyrophosphatase (non-canonical NTP hydrolase)
MISTEMLEKLLQFRREREWEQFHTFKNLAVSISLEAAELLEHVQWVADSQVMDAVAKRRDEVSEEMADIAIYLSYMAYDLGINLEQAVQKKLLINEAKYPVEKAKGTALKYDQIS